MIELWNSLLPDAEFQAAEPWLARLWEASLVAAVVIPLVWLFLLSFKSISPRFQVWVWRLVCCKLLIVLLWPTPIELAILPAAEPAAVVQTNNPSAPPVEVPEVEAAPLPETSNVAGPIAEPTGNYSTGAAPAHAAFDWPTVLLTLWCVGFGGCVLLIVRQFVQVAKLRRESEPCIDPILQQHLIDGAARLQVRRIPELCISTSPSVPLLAGVWRPVILLPAEQERFTSSELRLMIEHELGHMRRHDLLWNWLPALVTLAIYFHPAVWLLRRVWGDVQEAACDELLIQRQAARPAEYGHLLLKLSRNGGATAPGVSAAGILGNYRTLKRRIENMGRVRTFSQHRVLIAALTIVAVSLLVVVPWRLVAEEDVQPEGVVNRQAAELSARELANAAPSGQLDAKTLEQVQSKYCATVDDSFKKFAAATMEFHIYELHKGRDPKKREALRDEYRLANEAFDKDVQANWPFTRDVYRQQQQAYQDAEREINTIYLRAKGGQQPPIARDDAIKQIETLASSFPDTPLCDHANFKIGYVYSRAKPRLGEDALNQWRKAANSKSVLNSTRIHARQNEASVQGDRVAHGQKLAFWLAGLQNVNKLRKELLPPLPVESERAYFERVHAVLVNVIQVGEFYGQEFDLD